MKVLHAAETIKGGVATVLNSLTQHQLQLGINVICLAPSDQSENLIAHEKLECHFFQRNGRGLSSMITFFLNILKLIISEKPDVIHLHSSFAGLIGRLALFFSGRLTKTKVIYCPHAFSFLMETHVIKQKIYVIFERLLSLLTDKIICVSASEYDAAIEKGFNPQKLILIHNGVPIKEMLNTRALNHKCNYKLLFVGRFDYQKGIDTLASSIEKLSHHPQNTQYEFTLIGEAVNSEDQITFKESNQVKVNQLGWLKPYQLEEQYLNHDAIIIPSRWEGFAMVPLEAMSYGLPIIASDIDAFKELETTEQKHMLIFKDANELFDILSNIHTFDLEKNRTSSNQMFRDNFSEQQMRENTYKVYQD